MSTEMVVRDRYEAQLTPTNRMGLCEATQVWLDSRRDRKKAKTIECNEGQVKKLIQAFGDIPLAEFHIGHLEHYQKTRSKSAGASAVNHELGTLSQILKQAELWDPIRKHYAPLQEPEWKAPKILNSDEQIRLFRHLNGNPALELADIVFTITRNTTASGCELRGLQLRHLELEADPPRIHIPREATKNNIRPRTIPLNDDALRAFKRAVARASKLGSHYPEHFLFPFRVNRALYDPRKPASRSWLRKQVVEVREITKIEGVNPHVFRHLAVTELLEQGAPEQTVIALAGWVSRRMIETYSHTRIEAKSDAVKLLDRSGHNTPPKHTPVPSNVIGFRPR